MPRYVVSFYNDLCNDVGRNARACQRHVEVVAANRDEALATAKQRFAELEAIEDWRLHATTIEVSEAQTNGQ